MLQHHVLQGFSLSRFRLWLCAFFVAASAAGCSTTHGTNPCGGNGQYSEAMRSDGVQAYCSYVVIVVGFRCPDGYPQRVELPAPSSGEPGLVICSNRAIRLDELPPDICRSGACLSDAGVDARTDTGVDRRRTECSRGPTCAQGDARPPGFRTAQRFFWDGNACSAVEVGSDDFVRGCCFQGNDFNAGRECDQYFASVEACQAHATLCAGTIACGNRGGVCLENEDCAWDCLGHPTGSGGCVAHQDVCHQNLNTECQACSGPVMEVDSRNLNCWCE